MLDSASGCTSYTSSQLCMYGVVECRLSPAWHACTKRTRERQWWPLLVLERHLLVSSVNQCHKLRLCLIVHNLNSAKSAVHFMEHKKKAARHLVNGAMYIFALSPDKIDPSAQSPAPMH